MATSRQHMQDSFGTVARTPEAQNPLDVRLIKALLKSDKLAFQQALRDGANPNAMNVLSPTGKRSTEPPLMLAIYTGDIYFVKELIAAGADVGLKATNRDSPIDLAVRRGEYEMLEALLQKDPGLIDSDGVNLVIHAVLSFSAMALINCSYSTPEQRAAITAFYTGQSSTLPAEITNMTLDYRGNEGVLRTLFEYPAAQRQVLAQCPLGDGEESSNAWKLVNHPENYIQDFLDPGINPAGTVRCLSQADDTEPEALLFEVALIPLGKNVKDAIWLRVRYDFSDLVEDLRTYVPHAHLEDQYALLHREVERNNPYFEDIENLSPMKRRCYDALFKHLAIMLQGYQAMSTGLMQRNKNTKMDCASTIVTFIAGHAPSPWGLPFGIVGTGLSIAADIKEKQRYARIVAALPADSRPTAQELAYKITCMVDAKLESLPKASSLDSLTPTQVESLAKRAFVLAINVIHNLKDTDITKEASASQKADELMTLVLQAVEMDRKNFLNQLMVQAQSATKTALVFSAAANGNGYHTPHNADTHPSPDKKCILM